MLRFCTRLILFLTVTLIFATLLSDLAGHLHPALLLSTFMTNPDGIACDRPCLFGIYPGVTTAEQSNHLLSAHPLTRDGQWLPDHSLWLLNDKKTGVALGFTKDMRVDNILLTDSPDDSGTPVPGALIDSSLLGEYILKFGRPVIGLPGSNYFVIEYPDLGIIAALARPPDYDEVVTPVLPMALIMLSDLSPCSSKFTIELHHWMGFIKMQRYFDDNPNIKVAYRFSTMPYPPPYLHCAEQPVRQ